MDWLLASVECPRWVLLSSAALLAWHSVLHFWRRWQLLKCIAHYSIEMPWDGDALAEAIKRHSSTIAATVAAQAKRNP